MVIPSIRKFYSQNESKSSNQVNEIVAENMPEFVKHYDSETKRIYHIPDVDSVYKEYKEYVTPRIELIESLNNMAKNSNYNVNEARYNSGSNSNEQVNASKRGSNARTRRNKLIGEIRKREEEYKKDLEQANMDSAKELIRYIKLGVLHPPGGGRRTRKSLRLRKSRKNLRRKA